MKALNERASLLVDEMIQRAEELDVTVHVTGEGARVIDAGVEASGSLEAGRLYAEACMSGLGKISFIHYSEGGLAVPGLSVTVAKPVLACLASQYAGWQIADDGYFAMVSGPGRILRGKEPLLEELEYREETGKAVLLLESDELPPGNVVRKVAESCGVVSESLFLVVAPTRSVVASVQVAARVVETGMHKMHECGFDVTSVMTGWGAVPLPPVGSNTLEAMGWTNDAVLYGGSVWYGVRTDDDSILEVLEKLPSSAARDFGTPFAKLFKQYDGDFYKIDPLLFSPARIMVNNLSTGKVFHAGEFATKILKEEWGL
ncbi:MAG: methenyltetrahydromethanopterin cyclohydrolase [Thermovirgaceae bacterium]